MYNICIVSYIARLYKIIADIYALHQMWLEYIKSISVSMHYIIWNPKSR